MAHLTEDYSALVNSRQVKSSSSIASLPPIIDNSRLMRVGGRLKHSSFDYDAQHPLTLPRQHPVSRASRLSSSQNNCKCIICMFSSQATYSRSHYGWSSWGPRNTFTLSCKVTSLDFCGPFYYKNPVRNKAPIKCYICIIICFSTKAVHLELVSDLSTSAFFNAFRRFILSRGQPARIWLYNATNFVAARNELKDLKRLFLNTSHQTAVHEFRLTDSIEWRFTPPRSPHYGGLWEAAVKTAKDHFYRAVGPAVLTADDLRTLIGHIAAIVN